MAARVTAAVTGTGSYLPPDTLDNFQLLEMGTLRESFDIEQARSALKGVEGAGRLSGPEVFDHWAFQLTGIKSRRYIARGSDLTTEDMCARAGLAALEAAGREPSEIDMLYVASVSASDDVPNMACSVAKEIGNPQLGGYAINAACAGFVYGVGAAWSSIVSGMAERVLVVSGDALTRVIDYTDVRTAVVFADGAGAAVLERCEGDTGVMGPPAVSGEFARDPLYLVGQAWREEDDRVPILHMDGGPRILRNAVVKMAEIGKRALEKAGLDWSDVDLVIPHQANMRITRGLEQRLELPKGRVVHNIEDRGNMSASTVAVTLDEVMRGRHGPVPEPATIVLTSIGGGYTMAAAVVRI
ncbi:3-oxoacyl-ACP synthase III family protein [Candidatus Palauibacter sp.]|uniref:3-oxoacyl-ACP synthase III family protein n=1 Tax=Candidatus Palauibacter sp. TaxID=3101350 RepID=UPI003B517C99